MELTHQQAMDSLEDLAQTAYTAYADSTDNLNFRGELMPDFCMLPDKQRKAWIAATFAIMKELSHDC